eukprot:Rhum_TRINITY_DN14597_c0_g4::Rhum_TRINITY_DN14597_c0_g4_i1::g.99450::m.99450
MCVQGSPVAAARPPTHSRFVARFTETVRCGAPRAVSRLDEILLANSNNCNDCHECIAEKEKLQEEIIALQAQLIDRDGVIHELHRKATTAHKNECRKNMIKEGLSVIERRHVNTSSTSTVLHDSMHHLIDTILDTYGGSAGVMLLDVPYNATLGARNPDLKAAKLLRSFWEKRPGVPRAVLEQLEDPALFRDVLTQKKGKVLSAWELGVVKEQAHGLPGVHNVMAVPVVVDAASIALVLLLNGEYTSRDPKVLTGVLSELWTSNVQPLINLALDTERQKETEATLVMESLQRDEIILCLDQMLEDVVQEKLQWTSGRMSSEQLWRRILQRVADFFEEYFGADVLVAVTNTDANFRMHKNTTGSSGSVSGRDSLTERVSVRDLSFIYYVFSRNMEQVRAMKMKHLDHPKLAESTLMASAIESGEPYHTSDTKHLNLPCGHMKMNNVLLVPILFCEEPVGMLGLANGEFTVSSGRILQSVFKTFWSMFVKATVMSESQEVLNAALPLEISERVKGGRSIADSYETASVMFADIVGFTSFTKDLEPIEVVEFSNLIFARLDKLVQDFNLEKIKVIGDCYMVAGGLKYKGGKKVRVTDRCSQAQLNEMVAFALRILDEAKNINESGAELGSGRVAEKLQKHPLQFRIGIAEGPITAGVFGTAKVQYDVLGATVNLASRLQSNGRPGAIHVNESLFKELHGLGYEFEERDPVMLKGLGLQKTYFITGVSRPKRMATSSSADDLSPLQFDQELSFEPSTPFAVSTGLVMATPPSAWGSITSPTNSPMQSMGQTQSTKMSTGNLSQLRPVNAAEA